MTLAIIGGTGALDLLEPGETQAIQPFTASPHPS
jgi:hypothetical protein